MSKMMLSQLIILSLFFSFVTVVKSASQNSEQRYEETTRKLRINNEFQHKLEETTNVDTVWDVIEKITNGALLTHMSMSYVPSNIPSDMATTINPSDPLTSIPTSIPIIATPAPSLAAVTPSSVPVSLSPTLANCPGITEDERIEQILAILDAVANPNDIRNNSLPQGLATSWIISEDEYQVCPDDMKLVQRWALAVVYFSTNGNEWFQCAAATTNPTDDCGAETPFVLGEDRFLSGVNECGWAGINCSDGCVTQLEFGKF